MNKKYAKLFFELYCTLTTSQIDKALENANMTHDDWMEFVKIMKEDKDDDK